MMLHDMKINILIVPSSKAVSKNHFKRFNVDPENVHTSGDTPRTPDVKISKTGLSPNQTSS